MERVGLGHYQHVKKCFDEASMNNWYAHPALIFSQDFPLYIMFIEECACVFTEGGALFVPPIGEPEHAALALEYILLEQDYFSDTVIEFWAEGNALPVSAKAASKLKFEDVDFSYLNCVKKVLELKGKKLKVLRHNVNH